MIKSFLAGAIVVAAVAIALFFVQFRKVTRDRLFGFFAAAFFLMGIERVLLEFMPGEHRPTTYLIRLAAFLLILFAIWDKNRKESRLR